jgi:hypothetical protein
MELARRSRSPAALRFQRIRCPEGPTAGSVGFAEWVEQTSVREAAIILGCTEGSVRNWALARTQPSIGAARRIEELTGVPVHDWTVQLEPAP